MINVLICCTDYSRCTRNGFAMHHSFCISFTFTGILADQKGTDEIVTVKRLPLRSMFGTRDQHEGGALVISVVDIFAALLIREIFTV